MGESEALAAKGRFRGCHEHSIDSKGRVSIPSSFRSVLQSSGVLELVVTNYICDGARCLEAYPLPVWESLELKISKLSSFDPRLKSLENYYFSRAASCPVDKAGRILIPANLRNYSGLQSQISFTAGISGFRIWDTRVWEHVFREAETRLLENPDLFSGLDLTSDRHR